MITSGDDFPIHQTPEPVQQVFTSDRNFYDRFFFNGYWRDGEQSRLSDGDRKLVSPMEVLSASPHVR